MIDSAIADRTLRHCSTIRWPGLVLAGNRLVEHVLVDQDLVVVLVGLRRERFAAAHHDRVLLQLLILDLGIEHLDELNEVRSEPEHVQMVVELLSGQQKGRIRIDRQRHLVPVWIQIHKAQ